MDKERKCQVKGQSIVLAEVESVHGSSFNLHRVLTSELLLRWTLFLEFIHHECFLDGRQMSEAGYVTL